MALTKINRPDSQKALFGTGDDLEIYHSTNHTSYIEHKNANGDLHITSEREISLKHGSEQMIRCYNDGTVELYYDGSKRFETTTGGVTVDGHLTANNIDVQANILLPDTTATSNGRIRLGASQDLELFHNGTDSYIQDSGTGNLIIRAAEQVKIQDSDSGEDLAKFIKNEAVELYYNNAKKVETTDYGFGVTGSCFATSDFQLDDGCAYKAGTGDDFQLYHNGSHSYITNSTGKIFLQAKAGEHSIECEPDESVKLYYNNVKKLETLSNGIAVDGVLRIGGTAAANEFDDYEEGTFNLSPNLNNVSYDQQEFKYVKTGRVVHWHGRLHYDSASGTSDQILGLPFAPNQYFMTSSVYVDSGLTLSDDYFCVYTGTPQARLHMAEMAPASGINMPAAADIYMTGFYFTDS